MRRTPSPWVTIAAWGRAESAPLAVFRPRRVDRIDLSYCFYCT
jgi:hypothetical protein